MRGAVTLILILAGLVLAVVGFELGGDWPYQAGRILGVGGTGVSAVAAIRQYRESRPFVYKFSESDWEALPPKPPPEDLQGPEFRLEVPQSKHKKGTNPVTEVFMTTENGFEPVGCGEEVTSAGDVLVFVTHQGISGKLVIR